MWLNEAGGRHFSAPCRRNEKKFAGSVEHNGGLEPRWLQKKKKKRRPCTKLLIFFLFKEKSPLSFTFLAVLKFFSRANLLLNKTRSHSPRFCWFPSSALCVAPVVMSPVGRAAALNRQRRPLALSRDWPTHVLSGPRRLRPEFFREEVHARKVETSTTIRQF